MTAPTTTRPGRWQVRTRRVTGTKDELMQWLTDRLDAGELPEQVAPIPRPAPGQAVNGQPRWQIRVQVRERVADPHESAPRPTQQQVRDREAKRRPHRSDFDWRLAYVIGGGSTLGLLSWFVAGANAWGAGLVLAAVKLVAVVAVVALILAAGWHVAHGPGHHCPGCRG